MQKQLHSSPKVRISIFLALLFFVATWQINSNEDGYTGRTSTTSGGCGGCHGSNASSDVTVTIISGSGSFTVAPGSTTSFSVTVSTTNTNLTNAGVNLAVKTDETSSPGTNAGTLSPGTGLRLRGTPEEITQDAPQTLSGGSATWTFEWTAPMTPGTYYMRVLGFCGDGDGNDNSDDRWNWASVQEINVRQQTSVDLTSPDGGEEYCAGDNVTIRWTANGFNSVRIELSDDGGVTWPTLLIDNFDASIGVWTWTIPDLQAEGTQYRVRVLDALNYNIADTSENDFTIYEKTGITQQPEDLAICAGQTAVFRVTARGRELRYQWEKDGNAIPNATLPSYYINNATEDDEGYYSCKVNGLCDSVISVRAFLNIKDSPKVTGSPEGDTVCTGSSITLRVEAEGLALNYAWSRNGQHIPGSNGPELSLTNITKADSGSYVCIVSGACQPRDTSDTAFVVVYAYPQIIKMPQSKTAIVGDDVTFTVEAVGDGLSYQWRKDGVDIEDSTRNSLTLKSVTIADSGAYTCFIKNRCGELTTRDAILTVVEAEKPVIELILSNVDFGNVGVGKTKDTLLANVIHNNSRVPLVINSIKIIGPDAADFNVFGISFPLTIPAEEYRNMNIEFVPASLGAKTATITFNTNAENIVSLSLIGYGIKVEETLIANDWDFGDVLIGTNKTSKNFIKNIGTQPVTIEKPIVMSYDSLNFRLLDEEDYPKTINPDDSAETNFMFIPTVAKTYEVQVLVKNSTSYDLWFRLKGRGTATAINDYPGNTMLIITPNPAGDYIEIQDVIPAEAGFDRTVKLISRVNVYDVLGNVVLTHPPAPSREGERIRLDVSGLAAGVYFVRVGGRRYKFVKM